MNDLTLTARDTTESEKPSNTDAPGSDVHSDIIDDYGVAWPSVGELDLTTSTTTTTTTLPPPTTIKPPPPTTIKPLQTPTSDQTIETSDNSGPEEPSDKEEDSKPISATTKPLPTPTSDQTIETIENSGPEKPSAEISQETPDESIDSPGDEGSSGLEDSKPVDQATHPPETKEENEEGIESSASDDDSESSTAEMRPKTTKKPILGLSMDDLEPLKDINSALGFPETRKARLRKPPSKSGTARVGQQLTLIIDRKPR
jgi:hypothetical protein